MNTVIVLNWQELEVSKDSVIRLLKEPNLEVIVVDNGSNDGSKEYFSSLKGIKFVDLPTNMGSSIGRNKGIEVSTGENIFLLDGDILYVKGTIAEYQKILDMYPDAYCVGQNSMRLLNETGYNGTTNPIEADLSMGRDYEIEDWFPMAWTQYGLFRGGLLRKTKFIDIPPYDKPGYGLEDDWLHHEFISQGYVSLSCSLPLYYHFAHGGIRELFNTDIDVNTKARQKVFEKKWGEGSSWEINIRLNNPKRTYRKNP
jgi:glycosyltransferase involved in cell wall biosynthesis